MKRTTILTLLVVLFAGAPYLAAQVPNLATKIVDGRKRNAALMQQYTWNSRTELYVNGQQKDIRIEQVQYGPDGQLQRIQLNDDPSNHPRRFLRKLIAQAEKQQVEQYLHGLRGLLEQYTLPTAGKVIAFMSGATVESVQAPDGSELLKMQGSGVVVPGDTLAIWADASTHEMRKAQITTTYEGGSASVEATYKTNGAGLTHVSMAEVDAPAKNLTLQIHNYDYEPND